MVRSPAWADGALDDAIAAPLKLRSVDEIRRAEGTRKKKITPEELEGGGGGGDRGGAANVNAERFSGAFGALAAEGPEAALAREEERRQMAAAMAALPAKERAAVRAHHIDEETFVALAARIGGGVAESTVRGWRDAGIRRLRVSMSEMPGRHMSKEQR